MLKWSDRVNLFSETIFYANYIGTLKYTSTTFNVAVYPPVLPKNIIIQVQVLFFYLAKSTTASPLSNLLIAGEINNRMVEKEGMRQDNGPQPRCVFSSSSKYNRYRHFGRIDYLCVRRKVSVKHINKFDKLCINKYQPYLQE